MDTWKIQAAAAVVTAGRRVAMAINTEHGVIHAAHYPEGTAPEDAYTDIVLLLREHPDLAQVGVDFTTNQHKLREALEADHRIAGSHVTALRPHEYHAVDGVLTGAVEAATEAADLAGAIPMRAATDGAKDRHRAGFGWVVEDGRYGYGPIKATSALEAELVALERLLDATDPAAPLVVDVDSRAAIKLANGALNPNASVRVSANKPQVSTRATAVVLSKIRKHANRDITLRWVQGHADNDLNNAADGLAQLGRVGLNLYLTPERVEEVAVDRVTRYVGLAQAS